MSRRQIRIALTAHFIPEVAKLGFEPTHHRDTWTQKRGSATCNVSLRFRRATTDERGWQFQIYLGVHHAASHVGSNQIGAWLTQSDLRSEPLFGDSWCAEDFAPNDAARDAARSFASQAPPFFANWSDPRFTFVELKRRAALPPPSPEDPDRRVGIARVITRHNDLEGSCLPATPAAH